MTARGAALVFGVLVAAGRAVAAEPGPPQALVLRVQTTECATSPAFTTFVEALQVELAASGPRCCAVELRGGPLQPGALALDVDPCDPGADEVEVKIEEPGGEGVPPAAGAPSRPGSRRISLADVAVDARPRALALAVAELVRALPAPAPPAPLPAAAPAPTPTPPASRGQAVAVEAILRAQPTLDTLLGGGRLTLSLQRARWSAALGADAALGSRTVDVGTVDVRLVEATASAGPRFPIGRAALDVAATGGLGWAWVAGRPSRSDVSPASGSGLVAALGLRAGLEAPTSHAMRARVSIEGGETLRRLTGDVNGVATAGISGPYFVIGVGLLLASDGR